MIRRLFYFCLGAYSAVWAMRRLQALHPEHVARRAAGTLRDFTADVRSGAANRETELRALYGFDTVEPVDPTDIDHVKDGR